MRIVLDAFRADDANFITPFGDAPIENDTFIDIGHEAVIRCWNQISDAKDGWLWKEINDGLAWRSLKFQAQKFAENNRDRPSRASMIERASWVKTLPSPYWCDRYGSGQIEVKHLFDSLRSRNSWNAVIGLSISTVFGRRILEFVSTPIVPSDWASMISLVILFLAFCYFGFKYQSFRDAVSAVDEFLYGYTGANENKTPVNAPIDSSAWTG